MPLCFDPSCQHPENPEQRTVCQNCGAGLLLDDRYRLLKLIGQGGFGRTFLAVDTSASEEFHCVVKQFYIRDRRQTLRQKAADLFRQEAERLGELGRHPQIPQLLAYFETEQGQYLVQDYIDGHNLDEQLAASGPFDEPQIRTLLNDLLPVLTFIHRFQVIHRDIKPANIIRPPNSAPLVLVDFGSSKVVASDELKQTGTVIGSAGYVAPEQALGKAVFASDLYSLGVTCIHLLTGLHPFDLYSVSEDRWVWRPYLTHGVSLKLGRVLDLMLCRSLRRRYQTAEAALADLNAAPRPLPARRPSRWSGVSRRKALGNKRARLPAKSRSVPAQSWRCGQTLSGVGVVNTLAVSPNGRAIATGGADKTVRLWDVSTGELIHTFSQHIPLISPGHRGAVTAVLFSLDGRTLFSSGADGAVKWWDLATYQLIDTLPEQGWVIAAIALSADGKMLVSAGGEGKIKLWNLTTLTLQATLIHHQDWVSAVAFSPDGKTLMSGSWDKTIRFCSLPSGRLLNTFTAHDDRVSCLLAHPSGQSLISGGWDGAVKIWPLGDNLRCRILTWHQDRVTALALSPNGKILATGSEDSTLALWRPDTGQQLAMLNHDWWGIRAIAFTPDGQTLVSSGADEAIKFWRREE
ncbi:MAG: serine/threonine-protein kinase [Leptolyngbyaceae cyanobacterium MO_188.B28]|nr:serine/threonine-protein kinase [Leptolyngbyaceae cyanobacterium MO_188.B28]